MTVRPTRIHALTLFAICFTGFSPQPLVAQEVRKANWALAERFTSELLRPYVYSSSVNPAWINKTDTFWYSWRNRDGVKYWVVDAKARSKKPLFDHAKMAQLLSEAMKKPIEAHNITLSNLTFDEKNKDLIKFGVENVRFEYDLKAETLKETSRSAPRTLPVTGPGLGQGGGGQLRGGGQFGNRGGQGGPNAAQAARDGFRNYAPDRKVYAYALDHNVYIVETADETKPVQLSIDGEKYFSFGSADDRGQNQQQQQRQEDDQQDDTQQTQQTRDAAAQRAQEKRVRASAEWAPDSKAFVITRSDSRKVGELYLVDELKDPRPSLTSYKYSMPGEENVSQQEIFVVLRDEKKLKKMNVDKWKDQRLFDIHWVENSDRLRFVRRDRLQRNLELCEINPKTGDLKVILTESVENAYLERQNVRYIKPGGDFLWWSERSGWGHYYLHANDGKLKNPVSSGNFRADSIVDLDDKAGVLYLRGYGREENESPYYGHLYRVSLDGKGLRLLDPGNSDHRSELSPSKEFIVDSYSRVDEVPKSVLRDDNGKVIMELETMDVSRLTEMGWKAPETFSVKAADGMTDIYGVMWKPFDFNPMKKYPIIANVYPGPQTESVTTTFSPTAGIQRLAQLGFVVIQIGNRGGSPRRSNAYHSYGYSNLRDYGLADKKAGIEQLAARNAWIDVDRVGIFGHSGGGFMTAAAMMLPPYNEFFKVGVSSAGNHDNNIYNQNWSEQHHGLKEVRVPVGGTTGTAGSAAGGSGGSDRSVGSGGSGGDPTLQGGGAQGATNGQALAANAAGKTEPAFITKFEIKVPTNTELAPNLVGKLLLVHGDMDNNVHPGNTMRLVNALIKANKRFDLMIMPGKAHSFGDMQGYFTQLMYEYFAEHLLGDNLRNSADMKSRGKG